jgi:sugar (pentulose or hexulose) kinase
MVTTPSGDAVAMVHCNNCTGDLDAWVKLFGEAASLLGAEFDVNTLYSKLYNNALNGDVDCGGLISFNYLSGEHITGLEEGRPLFVRTPNAGFNLENFIRTHLYSAVASLKIGMNILMDNERVTLDAITGHGGFFKQAKVGQRVMSAALNVPVNVMETAGEGGAWGIAILADYMINKQDKALPDYLSDKVFADAKVSVVEPNIEEVEGFNRFLQNYQSCLSVEKKAVKTLQ